MLSHAETQHIITGDYSVPPPVKLFPTYFARSLKFASDVCCPATGVCIPFH